MRRHFNKHIAIIVLAATLGFLSGCVDDMIWWEKPGAGITLGVSVDGSWKSMGSTTRAGQDSIPSNYHISKVKTSSGRTLYLHEQVESWDDVKLYQSSDAPRTRTAVVTGANQMYPEIGVSAYHYGDNEEWNTAKDGDDMIGYRQPPNFFNNIPARGSNGNYELCPRMYWPETGKARMIAWAPRTATGMTYHPNIWDWFGPVLEVQAQQRFEDQTDILVAMTEEQSVSAISGPVNMQFKHAMTGIRFTVTDDMVRCRIKQVRIKNVYDYGLMFYPRWAGSGWGNSIWGGHNFVAPNHTLTYEFNYETGPKENLYDPPRYFDNGDLSNMIMMIPQWCPWNATIEVDLVQLYEDGSERVLTTENGQPLMVDGHTVPAIETMSTSIANKGWAPGTIVTYRIGYNGWWRGLQLTEPEPINHTGAAYYDWVCERWGITNDEPDEPPVIMNFVSFDISNGDVHIKDLDWRLEFKETTPGINSEWKNTPPDWISDIQSDKITSRCNAEFDEGVGGMDCTRWINDGSRFEGKGTSKFSEGRLKFIVEKKYPDLVISTLDGVLYENGPFGSTEQPYNLSNSKGLLSNGFSYTNKNGITSSTGIETTANCYIVEGYGEYIFPCIYGNAITNGSINEIAYNPDSKLEFNPTATVNKPLRTFVNHLGNGITSPVINDNSGCNGRDKTAEFIWSDAKTRPTNIQYDPDAFNGIGGIRFTLARGDHEPISEQVSVTQIVNGKPSTASFNNNKWYDDAIHQGNTTIALKDKDGKVMWSWHIWVNPMPKDPSTMNVLNVTNFAGNTAQLMGINLGWVSMQPIEIYYSRSCLVKMINTRIDADGNKIEDSVISEIYQREFIRYWHGFNPYWQWGRKDPFQPGFYSYNQNGMSDDRSVPWWVPAPVETPWTGDRTWGPPPDYTGPEMGGGIPAIQNNILHPDQWQNEKVYDQNKENERSYSQLYCNLWNAPHGSSWERPSGVTPPMDHEITKTIYDPCPPGYKVPPVGIFTGMTVTGDGVEVKPDTWNGFINTYWYDFPDIANYNNNLDGMQGMLSDFLGRPFEYKIYTFYGDRKKRRSISFPMSGYRYFLASQLKGVGNAGYYWTAEPYDDSRAYYMKYTDYEDETNHILPMDYYYQLDGFSIRPIVDEQSKQFLGDLSPTRSADTRHSFYEKWGKKPSYTTQERKAMREQIMQRKAGSRTLNSGKSKFLPSILNPERAPASRKRR